MRGVTFDLGLDEEDERAMWKARRERVVLDRETALELIADASEVVDAAVRRRPLFSGAPFTLPGDKERSGS